MSTHKTLQAKFFLRQARDMRERAERADSEWARGFFARLARHYEQEAFRIDPTQVPPHTHPPRPAENTP